MKALETNIINLYGERGRQWLEDLPNQIALLADKWHLIDIQPVSNMTWHYVAKVSSPIHGPVCLKLGLDKKTLFDECQTLTYFAGCGMIKVLDYDVEKIAVLLQQAIPGTSLKTVVEDEQVIESYATVVTQLIHSKTPSKIDNFQRVKDWLKAFDRVTLGKNLERGHNLSERARHLSARLLETSEDVLLHGDLHLDNILACGSGWVAIDPKGIVGPIEFEIAAFDFIRSDTFITSELQTQFHGKVDALVAAFDHRGIVLNKSALMEWVFIRLVLGACWMKEDGGNADPFIEKAITVFSV